MARRCRPGSQTDRRCQIAKATSIPAEQICSSDTIELIAVMCPYGKFTGHAARWRTLIVFHNRQIGNGRDRGHDRDSTAGKVGLHVHSLHQLSSCISFVGTDFWPSVTMPLWRRRMAGRPPSRKRMVCNKTLPWLTSPSRRSTRTKSIESIQSYAFSAVGSGSSGATKTGAKATPNNLKLAAPKSALSAIRSLAVDSPTTNVRASMTKRAAPKF